MIADKSSTSSSLEASFASEPTRATSRSKRRRIIWLAVGATLLVLLVGLGVGLGVGLTRSSGQSEDDGSESLANNGNASLPTLGSSNGTSNTTTLWQPTVGLTWNYLLLQPLTSNVTNGTQVLDIDLFDNSAQTIAGLQANGAHVICYFSAGSYENWRPDAAQFQPADLGNPLDGWAGERWLNVSSPNVHTIMEARLDLAVSKGCHAVDPDNVDGYDNKNGLGLTQTDAINYIGFLSQAAQSRGLAIGLKNAGAIVEQVIDAVQFSVQEQCEAYQECALYTPFIQQNKPVFHVEYPKGNTDNNDNVADNTKQSICDDSSAKGFSTILKNLNLDTWIETC